MTSSAIGKTDKHFKEWLFVHIAGVIGQGSGETAYITFANSLDPDQDQQDVSPDLDPNSLTF